jgi:hypothetical protein
MSADHWEEDPLPTPSVPLLRHRWVKLRLHVYVCRVCGMGRENSQRDNGQWFITWHRPDGVSLQAVRTPRCELGALTDKRLKHYATAIASAAHA